MSRGEGKAKRRVSSFERLTQWKLGLPMFEMFWAALILIGIAGVILLPLVQWIRQLLR